MSKWMSRSNRRAWVRAAIWWCVAFAATWSATCAGKPVRAQDADAAVQPDPDAGVNAASEVDAPAPAPDTDVMIVVGTPVAKAPGSAHVVSDAQLERFEYDDSTAILRAVPGVYSRGEDSVGLRPNIGLRGVNPDRSKKVTLMEDGVLFGPAPYSAPAAYYFPTMTRMTQVRVVKGPGTIAYGPQTVGGAIDVVTRAIPRRASGGVDLAGGEYGYNKVHAFAGATADHLGFLIEGLHFGSNGFKHLPNGGDTGFYRNEFMFKGAYSIDPDSERSNDLGVKLTYSDELSNETYLGLTDADFHADPLRRYGVSQLDRMRNYRTSIVATHTVDLDDHLTLTTDVYRHDFYRVWRKVNRFGGAALFDVLTQPDTPRDELFHALLTGEAESSSPQETLYIGPNERDFTSQGVQTRLRWDVLTGSFAHRVESGLRFHNDRITRRHSEDGFDIAGDELIPDGGPTLVTALNEARTYAFAVYATDAVTWQSLTLTPGVRFEAMRMAFDDRLADTTSTSWTYALMPGAGAYYAIVPDFGVLAGVYRGFSPPVPENAADVKPERSVNYEAGARFRHGPARVELIGFYNDYQNLTDVCTFSSGCSSTQLDRQYDAGKARIYGAEAFGEYTVPLGGAFRLPLLVAYTRTHAEFRNTFSADDPIFGDVHAGDEMPYVPRHQLTGMFGLEHPVAGGNASISYVSRMRELPGSGPISSGLATDAQFIVDVSAYYRPLVWLEVYANARNLFDTLYIVSRRPFGARPNAPRWIQIGTKLGF